MGYVMDYRTVPFGRREEIYELASAADKLMGYPRDHVDGEPGFVRGAECIRQGIVAHTETLCDVINGGAGNGVGISLVTELIALQGQQADIKDRGGNSKRVTVNHSPAGSSTVTNPNRSTWQSDPPRGGLQSPQGFQARMVDR